MEKLPKKKNYSSQVHFKPHFLSVQFTADQLLMHNIKISNERV